MLRVLAISFIILFTLACRRPVEPPTPGAAPVEQPAPVKTTQPEIPATPKLTAEILADVQDKLHDVADRSLGVALTAPSYANRPAVARIGSMKWRGATAVLSIGGKPVFEMTPREVLCGMRNTGPWRRAWTGRGGTDVRLDPAPQWWRFRASGEDAFIRVGATELTAVVYDATRQCWTARDLVVPQRTLPTDINIDDPSATAGPGLTTPEVFGKPGELNITNKIISYFDGSSRISFEPSDAATCAHSEWGKSLNKHWFRARFTSGEPRTGCPDEIDDFVDEMIEVRDQKGALIWASHSSTPGKAAPVGRRTVTEVSPLGHAQVTYEVLDQHGAGDVPDSWERRCKDVHRANLRQPVLPAASQRKLVGLWSVKLDGKELATGVGTRTTLDLDCVPSD